MTVIASGQVAVVTGAASGIGLALCERFADSGMHVAMADIDGTTLAAAAQAIDERGSGDVMHVAVDVRQWESIDNLAAQVYDRFGATHVLCNNAGVIPPRMPIWEIELDDWRWVIDVDLWGVIHGIKAFMPRMIAGGAPGHVVNTASIAGLLPFASIGAYSAAKYGVVAVSEVLQKGAERAGHPIGVSVLCPGDVATPLRVSSDRLRPRGAAWLTDTDLGSSPDAMTAGEIAAEVLAAISEDRFWVLPHDYSDALIQRAQDQAGTPHLQSARRHS